jgi:hypothetical protein
MEVLRCRLKLVAWKRRSDRSNDMAKATKATREQLQSSVHVFGRRRPNASGSFSLHTTPRRDTHFRDLPPPTGRPPYQLDLKSVLPEAQYKAIVATKKLVQHPVNSFQ